MTCRAALAATNKNKNKKIIKIVVSRYYQRVYVGGGRGRALPKCLRSKALRQFLRANTVPINRADILRFYYHLSVRFVAKNQKATRCEIAAAYFVSPQSFAPPV